MKTVFFGCVRWILNGLGAAVEYCLHPEKMLHWAAASESIIIKTAFFLKKWTDVPKKYTPVKVFYFFLCYNITSAVLCSKVLAWEYVA